MVGGGNIFDAITTTIYTDRYEGLVKSFPCSDAIGGTSAAILFRLHFILFRFLFFTLLCVSSAITTTKKCLDLSEIST